MSWRSQIQERDFSGFVQPINDVNGYMVVISKKGRGDKPIKCQSEEDVLTNFGYPSSDYPSVFEAISYCKKAPAFIISAIGDNALFGGVDVTATSATTFGTGRVHPDNFDYTNVNASGSDSQGIEDGKTQEWSDTLSNLPLDEGTLKIKVGNSYLTISDLAGVISGTDIDPSGTNTINYVTGAIDVKVNGTPGVSEVYDIICEADIGGSLNNKYFWIFTSVKSYYVWFDVASGGVDPNPTVPTGAPIAKEGVEVDIGSGDAATAVAIAVNGKINALTAFGSSVATATVTVTNTYAEVIKEAEDTDTGWSVWTGFTPSVDGTDSTGVMPRAGEEVIFEYVYNTDLSSTISHSFFTASPHEDDLKIDIDWLVGTKFKLTLYRKRTNNVYETLNEYTYSLTREKDGFGANIYIEDVFDEDPYLIPKINSSFSITGDPFASFIDVINLVFTGGDRGNDPSNSQVTTAFTHIAKPNKYPVNIVMDVFGNDAGTINTAITTYQKYAFGISILPFGSNSASDLVTARNSLTLDTDNVATYSNWTKIKDPYNDSFAWISSIGSIGAQYSLSSDVYNAESPAGVNENGKYGGQMSDWVSKETEMNFSDPDLELLDQNQINPIILDDTYGLMAYGDKTLQISLNDTSFIGHRRLFNYILQNIELQVMRKQEFKINDATHRLLATSLINDFMSPILAAQYLREYYVVCDESNNTNITLAQRKFIIDVYVKVTPNSQTVLLRLTKMGQGSTLAEVLPT